MTLDREALSVYIDNMVAREHAALGEQGVRDTLERGRQWQLGETEAIRDGLLPNPDDWCGATCLESSMVFTAEWILEIDAELDKRRAMLRGGYGPNVSRPQRTDIFRTVRDRVSLLCGLAVVGLGLAAALL